MNYIYIPEEYNYLSDEQARELVKLLPLFERNYKNFQDQLTKRKQQKSPQHLNITYLSIKPHLITAIMPVSSPIVEGNIIALSEHIAGQGSLLLCQDNFNPCGLCVDSQFFADLSSIESRFSLTAKATLISLHSDNHVWEVNVSEDRSHKLLGKISVTNEIIRMHSPAQAN